MPVDDVQQRLAAIRERVHEARERRGLGPADEVELVAVTKTQPAERVLEAIEAGIRELGENRIEELERKVGELGDEGLRWHYVGRLQRRQTRSAVKLAALIQSVHSHRIAEAISRRAIDEAIVAEILVQVNVSGEERKAGLDPEAALEEVHRICDLPGVRVVGLMTMAPFTEDAEVLRRTFRDTRHLYERASRLSGFEARHLSMGMTNDYEIAVEEGSTMIRLGTALFGPRRHD